MRDVHVLAVAQGLSAAGMMTIPLLGGILGSEFAPAPQLATLPVSLTVVGLAAMVIPAALLMERIGRRNAFVASALLAAVAALAVAWAIVQSSFWLLCAATLALGANLAFQQQHRFAAAESVSPDQTIAPRRWDPAQAERTMSTPSSCPIASRPSRNALVARNG